MSTKLVPISMSAIGATVERGETVGQRTLENPSTPKPCAAIEETLV